MPNQFSKLPFLRLAILFGILSLSSGCINLAANLLYAIQGDMRPAEFDGLKEKRVALICISSDGSGGESNRKLLESQISALLNSNVDKIDLVRPEEVAKWLSAHSSTDNEYLDIGKGLKADFLIAVDVDNLTLKNGATLYRGQCDINVEVYDISAGGKIVFHKDIPEFAFPKIGGTATTDVSEAKFRSAYLMIVAQTIASTFYEVESTSDFAIDATSGSF